MENQESVLSLCLSLCHGQICSLQERLQELSSLVQHWQQLHLDSEQTLALREEELVVCKVELAFLKEELSKMTEQVQEDTNRHSRHTTQDAGREPIPNIQKTSAAPQVSAAEKVSRIPGTAWPETGLG